MINSQKDSQRSLESLRKQISQEHEKPISPKTIRNKEKFPSVHSRSSSSQGYNFDVVTRDISHRYDQSIKGKSRFESHEIKLQEILGIKHEHYKLPSTLSDLQAFVSKPNGEETKEKLLQDLENMKLSIGIQKEKFLGKVIKEGGLLYRTQSGLLQPQVIKIYDQILKRTKGSSIELPRSDLELGAPSGRKEVEILITWLEFMIQTHIDEEKDLTLEEKLRRAQLIYTACYKEVIRQISVNCVERGVLMQRIWNASVDLQCLREDTRVKQIEELKGKVNVIIENSLAEIKEKLEVAEKKCRDLRDIIKDKDIKIDNLKRLVDEAKQLNDKDKLVYVDIGFHRNMTKKNSKLTRKKTLKAIEEVPSQDSAYIKQSSLGKVYAKRPMIMFGYFDIQDVFHKQKIIQKTDSGMSVTQYFDEVTSLAEFKNVEIMTEKDFIPEVPQKNNENTTEKLYSLFAHKSFQYPERRPLIKIHKIFSMNISIKPKILVKSMIFQQEGFLNQVPDENQEILMKKKRILRLDEKEHKNIEDTPISESESEESEEIVEENNPKSIQGKDRRGSIKAMKNIGKNKKNNMIKTSSKKYIKKIKEHSQESIKSNVKILGNKDEIKKNDTLKVSNVEYENFANISIGEVQKKGKKMAKISPIKGQNNVESAREKGREYFKEKLTGKEDGNSPECDAKDRTKQKDEKPKEKIEKPKEKIEKPKPSEEKLKKKDEKLKQNLEKPKIPEDKPRVTEDHPKPQDEKPRNPIEKPKPNEKTQLKPNHDKLLTQENQLLSPEPKPTDQKNIISSSAEKKQSLNTSFHSMSEFSDPPSPKYTQILSIGITKKIPFIPEPYQEDHNPKSPRAFSPDSYDIHTKSCQASINPIPYEDLSRAQLLSSIQQLKNILQDISNNEEKKIDLMKDTRSMKRGIKLDKVLNKLFSINEGVDLLDDEIAKISISCQTDESEDLIIKSHEFEVEDESQQKFVMQSDKKKPAEEEKVEKSASQGRQRKVSEDFSDGENIVNSASKGKRWSQNHKVLSKKPLSKFEEFILGQTTRRTIITHPGQKMLGLVMQSIDNIYNVQPSLTIKSLIKTINSVYSEKLSMCRDSQSHKKYEASMIMYDFLTNMYGLKTVAESKFKQAIVSTCFYRDKNARVRNFSKFLGIDSDYVAEDWNFFLGAFESIDYNSLASGILGEISHYSPLQRIVQCVHSLFDDKINEDMVEEIVIKVYGLKVEDVGNSMKKKGPKIIDAVNSDEFLDLMMKYYYKIKDKVYEKLKVEYARDELLEEKEYMELMNNSGISEDETLSRIFEIHSIVKKDDEERIFRVIRMESILNVIIDYSLLDTKTF
ncbi:hypothetical protein SteCoe_23420 [Stentor coeruleus]|uniref:Uncharacterized protein n=1 Tax=Stentor coeruleus TaxID=5963 RepID=A0A1R2BJY0_9CILI|nr:hypothetical protein SteCoe_23420 [Stentor coeruleus]